tara:strand:+ start:793 stop:906 length:114 start_codon:yes stop_codon:yes gene_type:complete
METEQPKQQVDNQAEQLTQASKALKNKEHIYKIFCAP